MAFPSPAGQDVPDLIECDRDCLRLLGQLRQPMSAVRIRKGMEVRGIGIYGVATVKARLPTCSRLRGRATLPLVVLGGPLMLYVGTFFSPAVWHAEDQDLLPDLGTFGSVVPIRTEDAPQPVVMPLADYLARHRERAECVRAAMLLRVLLVSASSARSNLGSREGSSS